MGFVGGDELKADWGGEKAGEKMVLPVDGGGVNSRSGLNMHLPVTG